MGFLKKLLKPIVSVFKPLLKPLLKAIKKWLTPDLPEKEALKIQRMGSDHAIPIIYGTRTTGAIIVDRAVSDSAGGLLNENYHVLAVFCYGEIDQFVEFFFNGVSWNDPRWTKNGVRYYDFQLATGTDTQTPLSSGTVFNRWNATQSHYKGLAIAIFTFKQDPDGTIWNGEPQITATIRGKKCIDPRTPNAPAAYTENPAVHLYDYVRSSVYGLGLTDGDIDVPSFVAVANIADTNETAVVDTKVCQMVSGVYVCTGSPAETVTFKRFSHNNIIDTGRDLFSNVAEIANSFRGFFPDSDGRIKIAAEIEGVSVFSFNADNIVSSITSTTPSIKDRSNRVVVRFPNVLNKYEMDECFYPASDDPLYAQWLTEDNGLNLEKTITAEYTVYKAEALQLAEVAAKSSRNAETVQFTATAEAIQCDVGDIVDITEENRGWVNKLFRISSVEYREDFLVNITAIQHDDAIYPWSDLDYSEIIGGTNLGDPANIPAPTDLVVQPDPTLATRGTLVWNYGANAFVRRYLVIILSGTTEIVRAEAVGQSYVIPQLDTGTYSIQVYAISTIGATSPAASISFTLSIPLPPSAINTIAKNFDITVLPVLTGIGLGTTFEFAIGDTVTIRGRGASIVFTGLSPSTTYTIYARTVNALGVSAWAFVEVTTTADSTDIVDLIGEDIAAQILPDVVSQVTTDLTVIVEDATADKLNASEVQALIDDSIALVNDGDAEDVRIELTNSVLSVLDSYKNKVSIQNVSFAVAKEGQIRAAQIISLNAADQAQVQQILSVQSDLNGTNEALSQISGQVNNPTTGLSATFDLVQIAKTTADNAASSATLVTNAVNDPVTGLSATATIANAAKSTADGNVTAINGLTTRVTNAEGDIADANLVLESVTDELGNVSARAYLGVTTTVGGVSRINGIVIDGATNTLEFRADTLRLSDTAGVTQLYWDTGRSKWIYKGDLVAGTFQTALTGYRAEMSGVGTLPFWYGAGEKNWTNALFAVDSSGNVKLSNASVQGAFISASGTGYRVEINNDATYLIWAGNGAKTDANGIFWVKTNGTGYIKGEFIQGGIIESHLVQGTISGIGTTTLTIPNHQSAGNDVELTANISFNLVVNGNEPSNYVRINFFRDGVSLGNRDILYFGQYVPAQNKTYFSGSASVALIDTTTAQATTYSYALEVSNTELGVSATGTTNIAFKSFENKLLG